MKNLKKLTILLVIGFVFLGGCNGPADPDEQGIPNGKDFKDYKYTLKQDDPNTMVADIHFYANLVLQEFFFHVDIDKDGPADFLIRCNQATFKIHRKENGLPINPPEYEGVPILYGSHYHIEFPVSALGLSSKNEYSFHYWFYAMDGMDRMPDSGNLVFAYVR